VYTTGCNLLASVPIFSVRLYTDEHVRVTECLSLCHTDWCFAWQKSKQPLPSLLNVTDAAGGKMSALGKQHPLITLSHYFIIDTASLIRLSLTDKITFSGRWSVMWLLVHIKKRWWKFEMLQLHLRYNLQSPTALLRIVLSMICIPSYRRANWNSGEKNGAKLKRSLVWKANSHKKQMCTHNCSWHIVWDACRMSYRRSKGLRCHFFI